MKFCYLVGRRQVEGAEPALLFCVGKSGAHAIDIGPFFLSIRSQDLRSTTRYVWNRQPGDPLYFPPLDQFYPLVKCIELYILLEVILDLPCDPRRLVFLSHHQL